MKIRSHLLLLAAGTLLPVLVFAAVLTALFWDLQREAYQERYVERVRTISVALESEFEATVRALQALAIAPEVQSGDLRAFHGRSRRFKTTQPGWSNVTLATPAGDQVFNINSPFGTRLPPFSGDSNFRSAIESGAPSISGGFTSASSGTLRTAVAVPVRVNGTTLYALSAVIDQPRWLDFLSRFSVANGATISLIDARGTVVARSFNNARWAGTSATPAFRKQIDGRPEGYFRIMSLDGHEVYSAFSTAGRSGWRVVTSVPAEALEADFRLTLRAMAGAAALAALVALALALFIGLRIARAVSGLQQPARTLAEGKDLAGHRRTGVEEVDAVGLTFQHTSRLLREREEALEKALEGERGARAESDRANRAKDDFLAMLGHELRNPIAAMKNSALVLDRPGLAADVAARARGVLLRQINHTTDLVNDLLDVARAMHGRIVLSRRPIELGALARRIVAMHRDTGNSRHDVQVVTSEAWADADETRVEQIVLNLFGNAIKYTPEGGRIRVVVEAKGDEALMTIEDDGSGISEELMPRLFEPFSQGKRTLDRSQGGLGLGLSLVKRLTELHGGRVEVSSDGPGKGARFTVRIPRIQPPAFAAGSGDAQALSDRRRVLLVEDNADSRTMMAELLRMNGHEVATAANGPEAVESASSFRPDVALVDIGLPGFDGYEVARRLKALEKIRLIALTGYGQENDHRRSAEAGFEKHLVKPVDPTVLEDALRPAESGG